MKGGGLTIPHLVMVAGVGLVIYGTWRFFASPITLKPGATAGTSTPEPAGLGPVPVYHAFSAAADDGTVETFNVGDKMLTSPRMFAQGDFWTQDGTHFKVDPASLTVALGP